MRLILKRTCFQTRWPLWLNLINYIIDMAPSLHLCDISVLFTGTSLTSCSRSPYCLTLHPYFRIRHINGVCCCSSFPIERISLVCSWSSGSVPNYPGVYWCPAGADFALLWICFSASESKRISLPQRILRKTEFIFFFCNYSRNKEMLCMSYQTCSQCDNKGWRVMWIKVRSELT